VAQLGHSETEQRLNALLDQAFAGVVARGEAFRSSYLEGAVDAVVSRTRATASTAPSR